MDNISNLIADVQLIQQYCESDLLSKNIQDINEILIEHNYPQDVLDKLLQYFTIKNNEKNILYLVSLNANIMANNNLALKLAVVFGRTNLVMLFAGQGIFINANLLKIVAGTANIELMKFFMKKLPYDQYQTEYDQALLAVIRSGHFEMFKILQEFGVDVNSTSGYALVIACKYGYNNIANHLLGSGVIAYCWNNLPLLEAIKNKNIDLVQTLVNYGARPDYNLIEYVKEHNLIEIMLILTLS